MKGGDYGCEARQYSDQKVCNRCGLVWDMNDLDPPDCRTDEDIEHERSAANLAKIRSGLDLSGDSP